MSAEANISRQIQTVLDHGITSSDLALNMQVPFHLIQLTASIALTFDSFFPEETTIVTLYVSQDATGSRNISWPASVVGLPGINPLPSVVTKIVLTSPDAGTTVFFDSTYEPPRWRDFSANTAVTINDLDSGLLHPVSDGNARTVTIASAASLHWPKYRTLTIVNEANVDVTVTTADIVLLLGGVTSGNTTTIPLNNAVTFIWSGTEWLASGTTGISVSV